MKTHCAYSALLTSPHLLREELDTIEDAMFEVKRQGSYRYDTPTRGGQNGRKKESHSKSWITINSHYLMHSKIFTKRFGVPKSTWVFFFESELGFLKRFHDRHKNGISEGMAMLNFYWDSVICFFLLGDIKRPKQFNSWSALCIDTPVKLKDGCFAIIETIYSYRFFVCHRKESVGHS